MDKKNTSDLVPNIKSVTIPPNWLKNRINPTKGYIEWVNYLTEKVKEKYNHNLNN